MTPTMDSKTSTAASRSFWMSIARFLTKAVAGGRSSRSMSCQTCVLCHGRCTASVCARR